MKKYLIILLFCCSAIYGQNIESFNADQLEKLEKILIDGKYDFNVYNLVRIEPNDADKSNNNYYDPVTFELIDLTGKENNFQGDSRENNLPRFELKKFDSLVSYKIINKDSIITLTTENENYPNITINLISNQLELIDFGYILNFEKEIIVNDNNNILQSGWAGFIWQKNIHHKGKKYVHSVTIGKTYDSNKVYFNIKTFINNKKMNFILISMN